MEPHSQLQVKDLRVQIDSILQRLEREFSVSRELALVKTKLEEAKMWAGKELGRLGSELPAEFQDKAPAPSEEPEESSKTDIPVQSDVTVEPLV